jgi:hypothetical protein
MKKTEGSKSRDTVPLRVSKVSKIIINSCAVFTQFHVGVIISRKNAVLSFSLNVTKKHLFNYIISILLNFP